MPKPLLLYSQLQDKTIAKATSPLWYTACRSNLVILFLLGVGICILNMNQFSETLFWRLPKFQTSSFPLSSSFTPWPLSLENRSRFRKSFANFLDENNDYSILTNRTFKYLESYRGDFPLSIHFVGDRDVETKVIYIFF